MFGCVGSETYHPVGYVVRHVMRDRAQGDPRTVNAFLGDDRRQFFSAILQAVDDEADLVLDRSRSLVQLVGADEVRNVLFQADFFAVDFQPFFLPARFLEAVTLKRLFGRRRRHLGGVHEPLAVMIVVSERNAKYPAASVALYRNVFHYGEDSLHRLGDGLFRDAVTGGYLLR